MRVEKVLMYATLSVAVALASAISLKNYVEYSAKKSDEEKVLCYQRMSPEEVRKVIDTPEKAMFYATHYIIPDETCNEDKSFVRIHAERTEDCSGGRIAPAALLVDDGYLPMTIEMSDENHKEGHAVYVFSNITGKIPSLYEQPQTATTLVTKLYGTIGISVYDWQQPVFRSIEEIVRRYGYNQYLYSNLDNEFPNKMWLTYTGNLALISNQHTGVKWQRF